MMNSLILAIGITSALLPQKHAGGEEIPKWTSVCVIARDPSAFNGKAVTLRAKFESDGIERSLLVDDECPNAALLPFMAEDALGSRMLDEAIATGHPGTLDKAIVAMFTGHFHYSPKPEMCMQMNKELCRQSLEITAVRDLILTMKQKSK